jgi:hypothetical protein
MLKSNNSVDINISNFSHKSSTISQEINTDKADSVEEEISLNETDIENEQPSQGTQNVNTEPPEEVVQLTQEERQTLFNKVKQRLEGEKVNFEIDKNDPRKAKLQEELLIQAFNSLVPCRERESKWKYFVGILPLAGTTYAFDRNDLIEQVNFQKEVIENMQNTMNSLQKQCNDQRLEMTKMTQTVETMRKENAMNIKILREENARDIKILREENARNIKVLQGTITSMEGTITNIQEENARNMQIIMDLIIKQQQESMKEINNKSNQSL